MSPLSARKPAPSAPNVCSCGVSCPVHHISVDDLEKAYGEGGTPPPSLATLIDSDEEKENDLPLPTAPPTPDPARALARQLAAVNITPEYRDDDCPPTPMRRTGLVGDHERTSDQSDPPPISPVFIVSSGVDFDIGEHRICGVFKTWAMTDKVTNGVSGQRQSKYNNFTQAYSTWKRGWEQGFLSAPVHPQSLWRRVVTLDELERRKQARDDAARARRQASSHLTFVVVKGKQPGIYYDLDEYLVARGSNARAKSCGMSNEGAALSYFSEHSSEIEVLE